MCTEKRYLGLLCTPPRQNNSYCWEYPLFPKNSRNSNRVLFIVGRVGEIWPRYLFSVSTSISIRGSIHKTGLNMFIRAANRKTHFSNRVSFSWQRFEDLSQKIIRTWPIHLLRDSGQVCEKTVPGDDIAGHWHCPCHRLRPWELF